MTLDDPPLGTQIGGDHVRGFLGTGGMGTPENGVALFPWMTDFDRRLSAPGNEQIEMDRR